MQPIATMPRLEPAARAWLGRVAASLAAALGTGALAYLVARAIGGTLLLVRQRQLLAQVGGALRAGLEGPPPGDLRAARLALQQIAARDMQISLAIGFVAAALAAVLCYLWLERRAARTR